MTIETIVSIDMSRGNEVAVDGDAPCEAREDNAVLPVE